MSNKSFAARYTGAPEVRSGGGGGSGLDLLGIRTKHQRDLMTLQHTQEMERMQKEEQLSEQGSTHEHALSIAKQYGLVPPSTSYDDLSEDQQKAVNDLGNAHIALEQKTVNDPKFQNAAVQGATALQAKPEFENNVLKGQAQSLSRVDYPPNTGVSYQPGGDFTKQPAYGQGPSQSIHVVGGITDPNTGQIVGGRPVETYGPASFPPVANLRPPTSNNGDSLNLTNTVATKPAAPNVVQNPQPNSFDSMGMSFATQPDALQTKPQSNPLMTMGAGPQINWQRIQQLLKTFGSNMMQGPSMTGTP